LITRNQEDLNALIEILDMKPRDIYHKVGDVSDEKTVKEFVSGVYDKFKRIDVLVNNAGIRFRKPFLEIEYEEWNHVMSVNAGSTFLLCREVGKYMIQQQCGSIINMASIVGTRGLAELVGYGASKGAIISMTKSLAIEWAEHGIRVNVLAPGFCETSYTEKFKKNEELYNFTIDRTPMKRWGSSRDISNACIYLASDMSSYITGETISIDGGWSAC
jgi:NAD(P)-dependent dehydrogenase (short-subunit alcohol dehydrogenase family)